MNTSSLASVQRVIEMAERRRDEALAEQARLQLEQQQALAQMDQIQDYAREAEQRWALRSAQGVSTALLMHHRQFMQKIHHAIEFQRGVLSDKQIRLERARSTVLQAEREVASLRRYTESQQAALALRAMRLEQKHTDEMAQIAHLRHQTTQAPVRAHSRPMHTGASQ